MTHLVLVGMSICEANERQALQQQADDDGATLAFLQHGEPALVRELDRLAAAGVPHVTLQAVTVGTRSPARSWLRRVAGHWLRAGQDRPIVVVDGRPVTGTEAPLVSSAWDEVPAHRHQVLVCRGPRCSARGADAIAARLDGQLADAGLDDDDVLVTQTGCLFPCNHAPVVVVHPEDAWFGPVDEPFIEALVTAVAADDDVSQVGFARLPRRRNPVRIRSGSATVNAEQASQTLDAEQPTTPNPSSRGENPQEAS